MNDIYDQVDVFHGNGAVDLPPPQGIARNWNWEKAQVGNCHPGACYPLGMVSALPYSGMYPTGYNIYDLSCTGQPEKLLSSKQMDGVTHFHQSGIGNSENFYNYFKVSALAAENSEIRMVKILEENASPGYYSCINADSIKTELTVNANAAVHRYHGAKKVYFDPGSGGILIRNYQVVPEEINLQLSDDSAFGSIVALGEKIFFCARASGGKFTASGRGAVIRPEPGNFEFYIGFSFISLAHAVSNCKRVREKGFARVLEESKTIWSEYLGKVTVSGGSAEQRGIFYSSLYHSLIKPCDRGENASRPNFYDFVTMWDMGKNQLPLIFTLYPERGRAIAQFMLDRISETGSFPCGLLLESDKNRFAAQASCLEVYTIYDAFIRNLIDIPAGDLLQLLLKALKNNPFFAHFAGHGFADGRSHSHTLDIAGACFCIAKIAAQAKEPEVAKEMLRLAENYKNVFNPATGLLKTDSDYYEGTNWNYSFRPLHDPQGRVAIAGGRENYLRLLETFFGYYDHIENTAGGEYQRIIRDNRFEGLNNETDMEAPYAFAQIGCHNRIAEIVRSVMRYQYGPGPGGLPGNDDSGGLSSWFVWNAMGLFPFSGHDVLFLGSPIFDEIVLQLDSGPFTIQAENNSPENIYVKSASINGEKMSAMRLGIAQFTGGNSLRLLMSSEPSPKHGPAITAAENMNALAEYRI
jgi:putative alpha-1,2-mannosidase